MDKEQFARQVTGLQGSLYRVAASYLRGESDRLDAVSEAIARAWEKRYTLRDETLFRTWITRILIRECVNIQRRQKRSVPMEQMPEGEAAKEDERIVSLREAIDQLPQRHRTMVVLHYMEGCDVRETARIMGTTKGAVCAGLARARAALRRMIGEEMDV
ncbi:MAG: sigma-70 family RNA polymerase sigma factor [Clostridia bacterium]|nr:sigma-70 family RNA polymerase sigma factor [Clostridia bacterium]